MSRLPSIPKPMSAQPLDLQPEQRATGSDTLEAAPQAGPGASHVPSVWATMPLADRVAWVRRFRCLVASNQQRLCDLMGEETKKPPAEGLLADVAPLLAACKWLERHAVHLLRGRDIGEKPFWMFGTFVHEQRVPVGKVGIIATWNYPVQLLGIQLIQALVAGNTVVVKPSERCPRTHEKLLELALEAGLPPGTLSWIGSSREAGITMLATQRFDHVVFTGSTEVGHKVAATLAKTFTPATLELSGRDSVFVLEDADLKKAAKAVWAATCFNAGQTCMGPRRVLVMEKVYDRFVEHLSRLASKATPVDLIDEHAAQRCKDLISRALAHGAVDAATLMGKAPATSLSDAESGVGGPEVLSRRFRPTALVNCNPTLDVVEGRHFGPLVAIVGVANLDDALRIHRACDQHLAASVFTRSTAAGEMIARQLGATNVCINDIIMPTVHPGVSIGGHGPSGMGLSRGEEGLLAMTRPMYVSRSRGGIASFAKPPKGWQLSMLARFLRWWYGAGKAKGLVAAHANRGGQYVQTEPGAKRAANPFAPLPVMDGPSPGAGGIVHSPAPIARTSGLTLVRPDEDAQARAPIPPVVAPANTLDQPAGKVWSELQRQAETPKVPAPVVAAIPEPEVPDQPLPEAFARSGSMVISSSGFVHVESDKPPPPKFIPPPPMVPAPGLYGAPNAPGTQRADPTMDPLDEEFLKDLPRGKKRP